MQLSEVVIDDRTGAARFMDGSRWKLTTPYHGVESMAAVAGDRVSVVVPTRNEAANIEPLVLRLEAALRTDLLEVIFVDDSDDDRTVAAIHRMGESTHCSIQVIHRAAGERSGGLGGAVVEGLRAAQGSWACVMDADLQHPPEVVADLLERARNEQASLAIASRYCAHGTADGLNGIRTTVSRGSTVAARLLFQRELRRVSDPMSGFFLVRKSALDLESLRPRGFKILLEMLVRQPELTRVEVPYRFGERLAEESKASLREGFRFVSHLLGLRLGENALRLGRFSSVGASGIIVNLLFLAMATEMLGFHYMLSVIIATQASTLWNFGWTDRWVFSGRTEAHGQTARLFLFLGMSNASLLVRGPMIYVLTGLLSIHYVLSTLLSLVLLSLLRYGVSDGLIWKKDNPMKTRDASFDYSVHGIVSVRSEVRLPELEQFLVTEAIESPTLTVKIGRKRDISRTQASTGGSHHVLVYDEGVGPLGFATGISIGDTIDIIASPLLRRSPHVLYTNVVEPILRWTFVKHGYALIHGACIAYGDDAYLVTARTDTGKTTTLLRILDRQRRASDAGAFISDDLTLVSPDGVVLTYPKPLTISQHTVAAINTPLLSWRERLRLPIQSRLHSRGGRRFALLLAGSKLPMATINALVQWLVPPPKYHVQRLIPGVRLADSAQLRGLFVIERGGEGDSLLTHQESLDILMSNCEDAYGFPPYESIKSFLHESNGRDLRVMERAIVAQALEGIPGRVLQSTHMDWSQRIPSHVASNPLAAVIDRAKVAVNGVQNDLAAGIMASEATGEIGIHD